MSDALAMSLTCSKCGATVTNDMPNITHPLALLQALRDRGWTIPNAGGVHQNNHRCPKCASLS